MAALFRRYRVFLALLLLNALLFALEPAAGRASLAITRDNLVEMASFLPPIFVLLGLLDVWVERETMMKYMGNHSGIKGMLLAFLLGSAAAGPLYAAFPLAEVMMKKGARMLNVFIFIGAWSTTKIPLIMFESATLGVPFMLLRLVFNIAGIFLIAHIMDRAARRRPADIPRP